MIPADRELLPTKAQIEAMTDVQALADIRDDIERQVVKMETDLEFRSDEEWAVRARNALAVHRYADRIIARHIDRLKLAKPKPTPPVRRDDEIDPLTLEVLDSRPVIVPESLTTVEAVDERMRWLVERINAVTADREEEIALPAGERDEGFLASTGNALRAMRGDRQALQTRRGQLSKAATKAAQAGRQTSRERLFIDAAREVVDAATFTAIWAQVDRMVGHQVAA